MLKYQGKILSEQEIKENSVTIGNHYFYSPSYNDKVLRKYLEGTNCICMTSSLNLNNDNRMTDLFKHIGFYEDISDFFALDDFAGIHTYYFKNVENKTEAEAIIKEVKTLINK